MDAFFAKKKSSTESSAVSAAAAAYALSEQQAARKRQLNLENKRFRKFWDKVLGTAKYSENPDRYDELKTEASTSARGAAIEARKIAKAKLFKLFPDICQAVGIETSDDNVPANSSLPSTSILDREAAIQQSTTRKESDYKQSEEKKARKKAKQQEYNRFRSFWKRVIKSDKYQKRPEKYDALFAEATQVGGANNDDQRRTAKDKLYKAFPQCAVTSNEFGFPVDVKSKQPVKVKSSRKRKAESPPREESPKRHKSEEPPESPSNAEAANVTKKEANLDQGSVDEATAKKKKKKDKKTKKAKKKSKKEKTRRKTRDDSG